MLNIDHNYVEDQQELSTAELSPALCCIFVINIYSTSILIGPFVTLYKFILF